MEIQFAESKRNKGVSWRFIKCQAWSIVAFDLYDAAWSNKFILNVISATQVKYQKLFWNDCVTSTVRRTMLLENVLICILSESEMRR